MVAVTFLYRCMYKGDEFYIFVDDDRIDVMDRIGMPHFKHVNVSCIVADFY